MNEEKRARLLLGAGILAAIVLQEVLRTGWLFPSLALVAAHHGAQALEVRSWWYRWASWAAMLGVPVLLLRSVLGLHIPMLGFELALVVFALLGRMDERKNR